MHFFESKKVRGRQDRQTDRHKITKIPQTTGQMDGQAYYTATRGILNPGPAAACAARNYGPSE